ncbi:hypothetical protein BDY24DRAFT_400408 [Mrakia frigida]|uniref:uncharacterized protein n=1 Tax=Mrakia frigida TaxID=29902 RepID=UPI003FCC083B
MSTPSSLSPSSEPFIATLIKNAKYVLIGSLAASQSGALEVIKEAFVGGEKVTKGLGARAVQGSMLLSILTVLQFLYLIVYMPYVKGVVPNYSRWQSSPPLTTIVPLLTITILGGFVLLVFGLKTISAGHVGGGSGLVGAVGGALGGYAAVFGAIGLIPTPRPARPARVD